MLAEDSHFAAFALWPPLASNFDQVHSAQEIIQYVVALKLAVNNASNLLVIFKECLSFHGLFWKCLSIFKTALTHHHYSSVHISQDSRYKVKFENCSQFQDPNHKIPLTHSAAHAQESIQWFISNLTFLISKKNNVIRVLLHMKRKWLNIYSLSAVNVLISKKKPYREILISFPF